MGQLKERYVQAYVEPTVKDAMDKRLRDLEVSMSEYVRSLLIKDLSDCGLLTDRDIAAMAVGVIM